MLSEYAILPPIVPIKKATFCTLDLLLGCVSPERSRHDSIYAAAADLCKGRAPRDLSYDLVLRGGLLAGKEKEEIDNQFNAGWTLGENCKPENNSMPFDILGYTNPPYTAIYRRKDNCEIVALAFKNHKKEELLALASAAYWESFCGGKIDNFEIQTILSEIVHKAGRFEGEKLRGFGAWIDNGEPVYNDGETISGNIINNFKTNYYYRYGKKTITSDQECLFPELIKIVDSLGFSSGDKILFLGWCVIAPICGALKWRPHIWITANHGSGKSTILEKIINPLIGRNVFALANSTEAGLRQEMGINSFPIIYDEAEGNSNTTIGIMTKIIELARKASSNTGGATHKGTISGHSISYNPQSCFCFASINPPIEKAADESRITELEYHKLEPEEWGKLNILIKEVINKKNCDRFIKNTVKNIKNILESIKIVELLLSENFKKSRMSDQFAPMIAGYWHVEHNQIIDKDSALGLIDKVFEPIETNDVDRNAESETISSDSQQCLEDILTIGIPIGGGGISTIKQLIDKDLAYVLEKEGSSPMEKLHPYGIGISTDNTGNKFLCIHEHNTNFRKLLQQTPWAAGIRKVLKRIDGIETGYTTSIGGISCKTIKIPIEKFK